MATDSGSGHPPSCNPRIRFYRLFGKYTILIERRFWRNTHLGPIVQLGYTNLITMTTRIYENTDVNSIRKIAQCQVSLNCRCIAEMRGWLKLEHIMLLEFNLNGSVDRESAKALPGQDLMPLGLHSCPSQLFVDGMDLSAPCFLSVEDSWNGSAV